MAVAGDTDVRIVTDPANAATVKTALDASLAATDPASGAVTITALGGGKAILITTTVRDF